MSEEPKLTLSCLVFLGRECTAAGLGPSHYWLQSASKAWHREALLPYMEREDALKHLPSSILIRFEPVGPAMSRGSEMWALRLGIAEVDEAELDREWISAPVQQLAFREPVDEEDDLDCDPDVIETAEERFETGKFDTSLLQ
jgi:hypothetical protein